VREGWLFVFLLSSSETRAPSRISPHPPSPSSPRPFHTSARSHSTHTCRLLNPHLTPSPVVILAAKPWLTSLSTKVLTEASVLKNRSEKIV
jgi:hypothetical protein